MVFLFGEGVLKTLKKKKRTDRRKTLKNEQKGKRRIQGKSNKNNICYYLLYKKIYFAQKNTLKKKIVYIMQDIWNTVMIHQISYLFAIVFRPHDLRPEIHINRLGTATQIFVATDYLTLISEKYLHFRNRQKHMTRKLFPIP